jgi:hypothetical protein
MFTDSSMKVDWGNPTLLQEKNNAQTCAANVNLIKVPQTNIISVLSSPFPPNMLPDNTLVVLVECLADPKSDSCPPSNASPRKFPAAHERGDSGIGVTTQYTHVCSIGLDLHSTEAQVLHSDAGRRSWWGGASDKVSKYPFYVDVSRWKPSSGRAFVFAGLHVCRHLSSPSSIMQCVAVPPCIWKTPF